jgi:ActR/RegA family two-component response regulator/tetratricopeptide (TPR) repeat protein
MQKTEINVLIVEDDNTQREALAEAVKRKGYRAVPIAKPDEAESIVKIKPIHAIICDCMLPGRNGVDLVQRLKANLVDGAAIIFVSGIYRDKSYANEAIRKTEALEFFPKPYNIEVVMKTLEKRLNDFIETPKVDLHALLAAPSFSARERRKSLDHVEDMTGYDLPFVFCILMDAESSGHLNIVDQDNNIFGVTMAKGSIVKVDSESTSLMTKKILIQHGFITEMDLSELSEKKKSGDLIKNLVSEGLMSPHVPALIRKQQTVGELNKLLVPKKVNINFVPDRKIQEDPTALDMATFVNDLHDFVMRIPVDYLKQFYSVWTGHPIRLGPQYQDQIQIFGLPVVQKCPGILEYFKKESTIEDMLAQSKFREEDLFRALHFLALRRVLVFEEVKRVSNLDEHVNRLKGMHNQLLGKTPTEIFKYFGLPDNPRAQDVTKFYKEFAKSNHPDTLPQAVSAEVRQLNHEVFATVTNAYEILSHQDKRKIYYDSVKQADAERQIRAEELMSEAKLNMGRGKYQEALPKLEEAKVLYPGDMAELYLIWARFKTEGRVDMMDLPVIDAFLKKVSAESRRTAVFFYVNGLYKRAAGDFKGAFDDFTRAIDLDGEMADARRDRAAIKNQMPQKASAKDILNGDISQVFTNIFKKRSG